MMVHMRIPVTVLMIMGVLFRVMVLMIMVVVIVIMFMLMMAMPLRVSFPFFRAVDQDRHVRSPDPAFAHRGLLKPDMRDPEAVQLPDKGVRIGNKFKERSREHIAGCPHTAVKIKCFHAADPFAQLMPVNDAGLFQRHDQDRDQDDMQNDPRNSVQDRAGQEHLQGEGFSGKPEKQPFGSAPNKPA